MNEEELNELTRQVITIARKPCLKRIAELERQLDSARAWAVHLEQELAAVKSPYAEALVASTRRCEELARLVSCDEAAVEKVAVGLIDVSVGGPYHMGSGKWAVQGESRDLARAAIAALRGDSNA